MNAVTAPPTSESTALDRWDVLTRTGPGTPAGELLRRYWQPVALSKEFGLKSPPLHLRVMSEDLVLFRDETGAPGLLDLRCAHRQADLSYGRVEDGGLRCPYHGWVFDIHGDCIEQPNVPMGQRNESRVQQKAYAVREAGGLLWAYLGPGTPPELPNYPFLNAPQGHLHTHRWFSECNFQQANEGNIDPSHTSFVHRVNIASAAGDTMKGFKADMSPRLRIAETSFGFRLISERDVPGDDQIFVRSSNFIMPNGASANGFESTLGLGGASMLWHVPIDDHTHYRYEISFHAVKPMPLEFLEKSVECELENGTRRRTLANRFLQDRQEMEEVTFAGVGTTFPVHDLLVTESMGPITNRRKEHLVSADVAIVRARRMLMQALEDVAAGRTPRGLNTDGSAPSFDDFVTYSDWIGRGEDPMTHAETMTKRKIYAFSTED